MLVKRYEHLNTNPWAEKKFKLMDNISDDYRLVYREHSSFNVLISIAYHVGWLGLVSTTLSMGYLIYKNPSVQQEKGMEGVLQSEKLFKPLSNVGRVLMIIGSFAVCIVLIVCSKTIPFRIYHNSAEKMYKAVFVNRIFGKKQIETFGEGTIVPTFSRKFLGDLFFNINGRNVLLDKECFSVPYIHEQMIRKSN